MRYGRGHRLRLGARRPIPFLFSKNAHANLDGLPDEIDLVAMAGADGKVINQAFTGTCFACAPVRAIAISLAACGSPLGFDPSVLDMAMLVHAIERAADGDPERDPLWDWGGDPADTITVMQTIGVRPARYRPETDEAARSCDASPDTVGPDHPPFPGEKGGVEPNLRDLETDAHALLFGAHDVGVLDPVGDSMRALAGRSAMTIAWRATDADEEARADDVLDARDGPANHDTMLVGYRRTSAGILFRLQNSWGEEWADRGRIWATEGFVRSASCRYAMTVRRVP